MTSRPILFSGPLVRAILAGKKTETRRLVTPSTSTAYDVAGDTIPWPSGALSGSGEGSLLSREGRLIDGWQLFKHTYLAPRIKPGDTLWVRETWRVPEELDELSPSDISATARVMYEADGPTCNPGAWGRVRQSIFMPRWASRITLRVTDVAAERLQQITNEGAVAEGLRFVRCEYCGVVPCGWQWNLHQTRREPICSNPECDGNVTSALDVHRDKFALLWADNPWVWVIKFERLEPGASCAGEKQPEAVNEMNTNEMSIEETRELGHRWADRCKWCRAAGNPPECVDVLDRRTAPLDDQERRRLFSRVRAEVDRATAEHDSHEPVEEAVAVAVIELLGSDRPWVGQLIDAVMESDGALEERTQGEK